jgi:hypothetical protein
MDTSCAITTGGLIAAFAGGIALAGLGGAVLVWRLWKEWIAGRPERNPKL